MTDLLVGPVATPAEGSGGADEVPTTVSMWRRIARERSVQVGIAILLGFLAMAVFAPVIAPFDPMSLHMPLVPPGDEYRLGTDPLGRDVLSFTVWGARVSLAFAFGAALISVVVGVLVGAVPTYAGGLADDLASRFVELFLMLPSLFLIITVVAIVGNDLSFVILVVGLTIWPSNAKLMRAQVLTLKQRTYVRAAVASGVSPIGVVFRHIVPNGMAPVIANTSLQMAAAVVLEAGLAFLGLSDPNEPSWGQLLNSARTYLVSAPWLFIVPGTALVLLLLSLYLIGDGIGRALDPRLRPR
jgi:peptide/nickel transport system permease protein